MAKTARWPQLILVNGPSSAGKTTLCRALQRAIPDPYLVVGFDDFVFMTAPRYYRGADTGRQSERDAFTSLGVEMITASKPGAPISVTAKFGPVFRRLLDSMAPAVRALVDGGNAVIFDHVLHDRAKYQSYLRAAIGLDVFTVASPARSRCSRRASVPAVTAFWAGPVAWPASSTGSSPTT